MLAWSNWYYRSLNKRRVCSVAHNGKRYRLSLSRVQRGTPWNKVVLDSGLGDLGAVVLLYRTAFVPDELDQPGLRLQAEEWAQGWAKDYILSDLEKLAQLGDLDGRC